MNKSRNLAPLGFAALVAPGFAFAQDVTAVETAIEAAAAPIALIGGAVLVLLVGVKVYKWIRKAL